MNYDPHQIALDVIARGFAPVPVPRGKSPTLREWQKLRITAETVDKYFNGANLNVGAIMGPASGDLTDVDLDCKEAMVLASYFLPETRSIYGRTSKRRSHYLYRCRDAEPKATIKLNDEHRACIVELRLGGGGKGAQSVMPGSLHHKSGERYEWDEDGPIADASCAVLKAAITKIAVGTILIRHWPAKGSRHDTALALGGFLSRAGWNADDVDHFVTNICRVHGEADDPEAHGKTARDSCDRHAAGEQVYGLPQMQEIFGDKVAKQIAKLVKYRGRPEPSPSDGKDASLDDFHAYMPQHSYIYVPSREMWPAISVNARIPPVTLLDANGDPILDKDGEPKSIKANAWLDQNRHVEQMTWAPGFPMLIRDRLVSEGGWIIRDGDTCFNLYRPPTIELGDSSKAGPWLDHVHKVFDDDSHHLVPWLAQRVQHPDVKINHALLLGSNMQGTGKDTALEPVKRAVGPWNFEEVTPPQMLGRFNGYLKRVILRVNEARDLGDVNRYQFYDHMKAYTAAPPDVLRVDEKHLREHSIFNVVGVILTTNYKTTGIFLPAEDRRHYVAWSNRTPEDFTEGYWNTLWKWYDAGGDRHVAAYLTEYDLSAFDPKAPPPKTPAFWDIVDAHRAPEDFELADVLDQLGNPSVTTIKQVAEKASPEFGGWLRDRRYRRLIPFRFQQCGYIPVRNSAEKRDGSWKIDGERQVVYAKADLSLRDQLAAIKELTDRKPRGKLV